jgi:predicted ATPase
MRTSLARHDQLIESLVNECHGQVVRPRGEGDSRFAVFTRASHAVAAACAIQCAFVAEKWAIPESLRIRIALHTGEADWRDGDYYGSDVNRCARLRSAAHGGQTLLSGVTAELVQDALPEQVQLRQLGVHRFRDLSSPERVYQLVHPSLRLDFPPLLSLSAPNNLPIQMSSFVGRERDTAELQELLRTNRLVTLTGPGGVGKTRLAIAVAAGVQAQFVDGVRLVDLSGLREPDLVVSTIAHELGLHDSGGKSALTVLAQYVESMQLLLVLDNFEQVIAASMDVAALLARCPNLKLLVTSRETLRLQGERVIHLAPLAVPESDSELGLEKLAASPAVQLFVQRARSVQPSFSALLEGDRARAVALICIRLDGLPLAIELAAAWVRVLDVVEIAERLSTRLLFLVSGPRDAPARQHSLRAALDWSYALLTPEEQTLLRRLSVFAGGWTLVAADHVCEPVSHTDIPAPELQDFDAPRDNTRVLGILSALIDKSLVVPVEGAGTPARYRILDTVREYAAERLASSDEEEAIRSRHAEYFARLAEDAEFRLVRGPSQAVWLDLLTREHDNYRAALEFESHRPATFVELRLVSALGHFWTMRGHVREGRGWLEGALKRSPNAPAYLWAKAAAYAGLLALFQGDVAGADSLLEPALRIASEVVEHVRAPFSVVFVVAGLVARVKQDYRRSLELFEQANAFIEGVGDVPPPIIRQQLGAALVRVGEMQRAELVLRETLAEALRLQEKYGASYALAELGMIAVARGNYSEAGEAFGRALSYVSELRQFAAMSYWLMALAAVAAAQERFYQAAKLLGTANVLCNRCGIPLAVPPYLTLRDLASRMDIPQIVHDARVNLGLENFNVAWRAGAEGSAADALVDVLNAGSPETALEQFLPDAANPPV